MERTKREERPVLAVLRGLGIGESVTFPAERTSYVKSACSQFGFEWGKTFRCSNDREERQVRVTRTA